MIKSKALEVNIADYYVDVVIDEKYAVIQDVMSKYYGLTEGLNTFLKELSHPYKNWQFIVQEARGYCLNYFHLLKNHPQGPAAAGLFVEIFAGAINQTNSMQVKADAVETQHFASGSRNPCARYSIDRTSGRVSSSQYK